MDEEKPDVFSVSVGNLPPGAEVLVKVTYVTELQVEGMFFSFFFFLCVCRRKLGIFSVGNFLLEWRFWRLIVCILILFESFLLFNDLIIYLGDGILFILPCSVSPQTRRAIRRGGVKVGEKGEFKMGVELGVDMPFKILSISSPSHEVLVKRTGCYFFSF